MPLLINLPTFQGTDPGLRKFTARKDTCNTKKMNNDTIKNINLEAKNFVKQLKLDDRIKGLSKKSFHYHQRLQIKFPQK